MGLCNVFFILLKKIIVLYSNKLFNIPLKKKKKNPLKVKVVTFRQTQQNTGFGIGK